LLRRRQVSGKDGPGPAFLLFAGWMSCLHFMYYDVMLTFLPLCLLFSNPRRFLQLKFWPSWLVPAYVLDYYHPSLAPPPPLPLMAEGRDVRWVINPLPPLLLMLLLVLTPLMIWCDPSYHFPPVDTFCILALWAWCGWVVWRKEASEEAPVTLRAAANQDENPYAAPSEDATPLPAAPASN
jgi:hypothetical protein